jgi:hypothetical protein
LLYIFVVREKSAPAAPLPTVTKTVTVPPPSPVISPAPKESGTTFYDALPTTVGAYVFTAAAENPDWETLGAFDAYTLTYSDGSQQITLLAGQWRTDDAAAEAFAALGGPAAWPGAEVDLTSKTCPQAPDVDTRALWANRTAVFQIDAPDAGAAQFFCLMPM